METLNLSGTAEREDNFFQRLFWPTVRNQYDVDLIGRRGFWVAVAVGVLSAAVLTVQGHAGLALFTLVVFLLGATGVRERDLAAAVLVFALYFTGVAIQCIGALRGLVRIGNPLITLVCVALLLACVRATLLSRRFAAMGDTELPNAGSGVLDGVADRFPRRVWPRARVVFYVLAGMYLALTIAGAVALLSQPRPVVAEPETPAATLTVR